MKPLTIKLYNKKKGEYETYTQDFIPFRKTIEYLESQVELYEKFSGRVPEIELMKFNTEFIASLFPKGTLTANKIYDGLDARNQDLLMNLIYSCVLGVKDDEVADEKKEV